MANYFVTTAAWPDPTVDQARWQLVCENGKVLHNQATSWGGQLIHINDENATVHCWGDNECDDKNDAFRPDNAAAELADIVRLVA